MNIHEKINEIIIDRLGKPKIQFNENTNLRNDLGLNSFELAQMAVMIEEDFDIVLDDTIIYQIHTLKDVHDLISKTVEKK